MSFPGKVSQLRPGLTPDYMKQVLSEILAQVNSGETFAGSHEDMWQGFTHL